ncbi:MAG: hypothetical protein QW775_03070 [Ignisphaera sp.]|uniref:Archaeal Type IV pilin N-terminal domain-containing protein n=1 Tax=Ignisphaera aggregans TaxID=334771 RepID=A0A7C4JJE9_9CREN
MKKISLESVSYAEGYVDMGIEYMILATISCIVFALVVFSFLTLYLYIVDQTNKIPSISIDLDARKEGSNALITVIVRHKGGEKTTLKYSTITTDKGIIEINFEDKLNNLDDISVEIIGFKDNKTILSGSTARINFKIASGYFDKKYEYTILIVFDKTEVVSSFKF